MHSLGDPRVDDRRVAGEVGERNFLRDAFEYQHRERVRVGMYRCGEIIAFDDLDG